ncbi:MAG: Glycosyl transferase family 2 [Berkelbacteria bacterium GW2011_GWA2_35_9]|uniref:Glycosyl transferase family 2 n=1 Tax=Berkelbacteria bacterium GW2011_GWA2_35_9 TaxID=1618333 RepID=A0A0G0FN55_9BACT|nr:MAG: Glycosyl transferase family 2 [Berkelbacteria bacterium GW2011_GWA2_35_9]
MQISIITVVLNNKKYIEDCIRSVYDQTYKNYEHIIIDGGSTDGTIELLKSLKLEKLKINTKKDYGIYDAMNKGIELAKGEIIVILNSDDIFADKNVLSLINSTFKQNRIEFFYSRLEMYDEKFEKIVRSWKTRKYSLKDLKIGYHPPHPTLFVKKKVYNEIGKFRTDMTLASDYEFVLRLFFSKKYQFVNVSKVLVKMRYGGVSTRNFMSHIVSNYESYKSWQLNNLKIDPLIMVRKPLLKIKQFKIF